MKRIFIFMLIAIIAMSLKYCNRKNASDSRSDYNAKEDTFVINNDGSGDNENSKQEEEDMQMLITLGNTMLTVNMLDCETTREFILCCRRR